MNPHKANPEGGEPSVSLPALTRVRCFNHAEREAAVRCPKCRRFFCRECVSEYEQRFLCAACLAACAPRDTAARRYANPLRTLGRLLAGIIILWMSFYVMGRALLAIPSDFHDYGEREAIVNTLAEQ